MSSDCKKVFCAVGNFFLFFLFFIYYYSVAREENIPATLWFLARNTECDILIGWYSRKWLTALYPQFLCSLIDRWWTLAAVSRMCTFHPTIQTQTPPSTLRNTRPRTDTPPSSTQEPVTTGGPCTWRCLAPGLRVKKTAPTGSTCSSKKNVSKIVNPTFFQALDKKTTAQPKKLNKTKQNRLVFRGF